jgi:hypothetical protein
LAANQLHGVVMNRGRALLWCRRRCLREHDAGVSSPAPRASAGSLGHDASDAQHTTLRTHSLSGPPARKKKTPTDEDSRAMHEDDFKGGGGAPEQLQVALAPQNNLIAVSRHWQ